MWLFKKENQYSSDDIAQSLYNDLVTNYDLDQVGFDIEESRKLYFKVQMRVYKSAIIIIALLNEEQKNKDYLQIRIEFEKIIFSMPKQEIAINFFKEVKNAMISLNTLLFSNERKELTWAMNWLKQIDIKNLNPVDLTMLATHFMDFYIMVVKILEDCEPT